MVGSSSHVHMSSFPLPEAYLIAFFVESLAYGMHLVAFFECVRKWMHRFRQSSRGCAYRGWIAVAIFLFVLGTLHVSLTCYHNILAFVLHEGPPDEILEQLSSWIYGTLVSGRDPTCRQYHLIHLIDSTCVTSSLLHLQTQLWCGLPREKCIENAS